MAKGSIPEKKYENGIEKEEIEDTANGWPDLIPLKSPKDSPGLKEEESPKDSSGWKEKSGEVAASEQNTSKGKDRSLPRSNKKRKRKTWSNKFAAKLCSLIGLKLMWMLPLVLMVPSVLGANEEDINVCVSNPCQNKGTCVDGLDSFTCNCAKGYNGAICQNIYLEVGKFRKITIATNETQIATDPIEGQNVGSIFTVVAKDGNDHESFKTDSDFVSKNQSCSIWVGDRNNMECEGLLISGNGPYIYLALDGSKLTRTRTIFCIFQQVPSYYALYFLDVFKNQDQDINKCVLNPCQNGGTCVDGLASYTCNCAKGYGGGDCEIVDVQREDFRSITMATSETEVATDLVPKPVNGANYLIFARDENDPGSYKCTPEFVAVNQSCNIYMGDKNKTECEGLLIFGNETHIRLIVDGSKLTYDHTTFCILQQFPGLHSLYPLGVFKKHNQAPETNHYKVAFYIFLGIVLVILLVMVGKVLCAKSKQEPTDDIEKGPFSPVG